MYGFISIENTVIVFGAGVRGRTSGYFVTFVQSPSHGGMLDFSDYSQL